MTPNYFNLNQGAAGTTDLAAAVAGKRHKVLGFMFSPSSSGTRTFQFSGSVSGPLHGVVTLQSGGVPTWPGMVPFIETAADEILRIVTTGGAFRGVIQFITEA